MCRKRTFATWRVRRAQGLTDACQGRGFAGTLSPVVELRRLRRRVPRDLLRVLERPPVRQVRRDPVARNVWQHVEGGRRTDPAGPERGRGPAAETRRLIIASTSRRSSAAARQPPPRQVAGLEERHLRLLEAARLDVGRRGQSRSPARAPVSIGLDGLPRLRRARGPASRPS